MEARIRDGLAAALLAAGLLVPPACGSAPAPSTGASRLCGHLSQAASLKVRRVSTFTLSHAKFGFPSTVQVTDVTKAHAVARAACSLPKMPRRAIACPADPGVIYRLTFTSAGGRTLAVAKVAASGGQDTTRLGNARTAPRSPGFWRVLGQALELKPPYQPAFAGTAN